MQAGGVPDSLPLRCRHLLRRVRNKRQVAILVLPGADVPASLLNSCGLPWCRVGEGLLEAGLFDVTCLVHTCRYGDCMRRNLRLSFGKCGDLDFRCLVGPSSVCTGRHGYCSETGRKHVRASRFPSLPRVPQRLYRAAVDALLSAHWLTAQWRTSRVGSDTGCITGHNCGMPEDHQKPVSRKKVRRRSSSELYFQNVCLGSRRGFELA